jgi:hypothetical protein
VAVAVAVAVAVVVVVVAVAVAVAAAAAVVAAVVVAAVAVTQQPLQTDSARNRCRIGRRPCWTHRTCCNEGRLPPQRQH